MKPLKYMPCTIQKMSSYYIPLLGILQPLHPLFGGKSKDKIYPYAPSSSQGQVLNCTNFLLPRTIVLGRKYKLYIWITVPFWTFKEEATYLSWLVTQQSELSKRNMMQARNKLYI